MIDEPELLDTDEWLTDLAFLHNTGRCQPFSCPLCPDLPAEQGEDVPVSDGDEPPF